MTTKTQTQTAKTSANVKRKRQKTSSRASAAGAKEKVSGASAAKEMENVSSGAKEKVSSGAAGVKEISGFSVLPVQLEVDVLHYLYVRTDAPARLFVCGLPCDTLDAHLLALFPRASHSSLAAPNSDSSEPQPLASSYDIQTAERSAASWAPLPSGSFTHVHFASPLDLENSLRHALSLPLPPLWHDLPAASQLHGLEKYMHTFQNSRISHVKNPAEFTALEQRLAGYMAEFDAMHAEKQAERLAKRGVPDQDGWVTVVSASTVRKDQQMRKKKKKHSGGELVDFYRFQMKETKRKRMSSLSLFSS